ncbi:protein BatD [Candidatus Gracilibacteria bacterium]|nr:protein BatD [Candidatus Gracilibacteria bacterium]
MFQKLTLFFISLMILLSVNGVFANEDITLQVSRANLEVGQDFDVAIELNGELSQGQNMQIKVNGLENFKISSQSQATSIRTINGVTSSVLAYSVKLHTSEVGEYVVGPVSVLKNGNEFIDDELFTVTVGEIGSLSPAPPVIPNQNTQDVAPTDNIDSDIQDLRRSNFPLSLIVLGIIVFLIAFYFLIGFILKQKRKGFVEENNISPVIPPSYYQQKIGELRRLESNMGGLRQQEFYRKYNHIIRDILRHEGNSLAEKATLSEMMKTNSLQSSPVFNLFQETYYKEFADRDLSIDEETVFVNKLVQLLSQK